MTLTDSQFSGSLSCKIYFVNKNAYSIELQSNLYFYKSNFDMFTVYILTFLVFEPKKLDCQLARKKGDLSKYKGHSHYVLVVYKGYR